MSLYDYYPAGLTWVAVDPATHPFDAEVAAGIIASVPWAADDDWTEGVLAALDERLGPWTRGWAWARDEGDFGGGPVTAWCCGAHSVTTPTETSARALTALREWRGWLERLADLFPTHALPAGSEEERLAAWERAVPVLVDKVVDRTGAGDAWYRHCAQVLEWFLTYHGIADVGLVEEAIGGRFQSWSAPEDSEVTDLARRIAAADSGA
ncbi:hypothetical protein AB0F91_10470 [Amycolatopsis sp. NPDC023774]|uniref:hypothetical protein n=1 Tax=Amycolatopsis sp. NPDC023774 TaxID=3155015 RepID=UPI0033C5E394